MPRERFKDATNNSVLKRLYKRVVAAKYGLCHLCRYNRCENANRQPWKSWKRLRKTQYKIKEI